VVFCTCTVGSHPGLGSNIQNLCGRAQYSGKQAKQEQAKQATLRSLWWARLLTEHTKAAIRLIADDLRLA
jgi:Na+-transporting NADH:ubiquinone oxidoreductase subunit NqrC